MYIAAIPLEQKQAVVQTQQDWSVGKMLNAKAEADFNEATTQLTVARNDQKAAQLAVDSAISTKKAAEASADTTRINQATKDEHAAETAYHASEARVKYLAAYRDWLTVLQLYTAENMYWREAQYELRQGAARAEEQHRAQGLRVRSLSVSRRAIAARSRRIASSAPKTRTSARWTRATRG